MTHPIIAIAMGDPFGIGPELIVKALSQNGIYKRCRPIVIGDPTVIRDAVNLTGIDMKVSPIEAISDARFSESCIEVFHPEGVEVGEIKRGTIDPAAGKAAALCLRESYSLAMAGKAHGVISAPLNKEAFHLAGYDYLDELEFLADFTDSPDALIMGVMDSLWTVAVTTHIPFRDIAGNIRQKAVLSHIVSLQNTLRTVGVERPRIAVAALNVHGGEGGLFGREEIDEIIPAIESSKQAGILASGPIPADSVFIRAIDGEFDGVVSMYHDQATIVRKLHAKKRGATVFIGLPVVCGTTAHGTAFDIAGKGIAEPGSIIDALDYTIQLAGASAESRKAVDIE